MTTMKANQASSPMGEKWIGRLVEIVNVKYYEGQLATIDDIEHMALGYRVYVTTIKGKELTLLLGDVKPI